jgi:hypothetical protein
MRGKSLRHHACADARPGVAPDGQQQINRARLVGQHALMLDPAAVEPGAALLPKSGNEAPVEIDHDPLAKSQVHDLRRVHRAASGYYVPAGRH